MLSVHAYHQPFAPIPSSGAVPTRRHKELVVERGRSRTVSQAALARKRSEERRKRAAVACQRPQQVPRLSTSHATFSSASKPCASSSLNPTATPIEDTNPVASSSSCRLPSPTPYSQRSTRAPEQPSYITDSTVEASDSSRRNRSMDIYTSVAEVSSDEDDEALSSEDSLSLEEQMQQAYAACQIIHATPGRNHCRCQNMRRARVLYLKTQGIDVTSDDDPRVDQVRDEDFVFVPGGEVVLDEESLAVINEERDRRAREATTRRRRVCDQTQEVIPDCNAELDILLQRRGNELRLASQSSQRLEFRLKRDRPVPSSNSGLSPQHTALYQPMDLFSTRSDLTSDLYPIEVTGTKPPSISSREIIRSLHGPLFPDTEPHKSRTSVQEGPLNLLLEPVISTGTDRGWTNDRTNLDVGLRTWTYNRLYQGSGTNSSCVACSLSSDSTISRTNSWASATSGASSSTSITPPPSSPRSGKLQLQPLVEDNSFREQLVHSCQKHWRSRLKAVSLSDAPLHFEGIEWEQSVAEPISCSSLPHKENVASVLISRVRQSVSGLVDFASRMQQSYLRTIQFAIILPPEIPSHPPEWNFTCSRKDESSTMPFGCCVSASDVQRFAPYPISGPTRDLNFPSDLNIPLRYTRPDSETCVRPRVFAPLAFVPPSPLRPRETPLIPEWRLRPVANPCTLRLKAHANCLNEKGIPWEGRAYTGSLGCGRERLTGVAFEGLGGSRLAFEAK